MDAMLQGPGSDDSNNALAFGLLFVVMLTLGWLVIASAA
jgi:hypothetical protein